MNASTTDHLIDDLRRLHLLEPDQLDELTRSPSQFPSEPKSLAAYLMQRGWLTAYQANRLLVGRGQELVLGSYVMLERLGEGGMGAVFKARNWKLGALRALKVIRKDRTAQATTVQRFQREMRAAAQLSHPNVVHAHDADEVDGVHYIAMELLSGMDLSRRVAEGGPLPVEQACEYIRQAALGLQHAHECGLVHRDVKPSNLLVTSAGVVKILDLGLARLAPSADGAESQGTLTQTGALMGTPDYMAPEQARHSHGVDARADLYSLGATMYFLLTGRPPFPPGPLAATIAALLFNDPEPVESLRPETPPAVARVVHKLTAKKPEDRFQTGGELADALSAILAGEAGDTTLAASAHGAPAPLLQPSGGDADTVSGPITVPSSAPANPRPAAPRRSIPTIYFAVALAVAILAFGIAGLVKIMNSLPSANPPAAPGKFALQCDDPEVRVLVRPKGGADVVEVRPNESLDLAAGDYALELAPVTLPGLRLSRKTLRLAAGADETVRVEGFPLKADALVSRPGWIEGVRSWTIETRDKTTILHPLAYSPDGRWLAGGVSDGSIRLLDGRTGAPYRTLTGHTGKLRALAWSADRDKPMLASSGTDGVRLWDPQSGPLPFRQNLDGAALAFAPDGKTLAVAVDLDIYLWNLANQNQLVLPRKHTVAVRVLAWAPDGKTLASGSTNHVQFWHAPDAAHADWTHDKLSGHAGAIHGLAWSPNSATAASTGADGTIRFWDLSDLNKPEKLLAGAKGEVLGVSWVGADASTVASIGADASLRLWDAATGELRRTVAGGSTVSKFTPDGSLMTATGAGWTVRLLETASGRPLGTVVLSSRGTLVVSEDGHYRCYADKPGQERAIEDQMTYIVQTEQGPMKYTPQQFATTFAWKNNPENARLDTR